MGIRSFVRKAAKPLAMTAVAGSLAVSLVVTTPSNAQAFVAPVLPVVAGAAEIATGVAAITPLGWVVLGGVALAAGLYYTKDYWMPYLTGDLGKNAGTSAPVSGSYAKTTPNLTLSELSQKRIAGYDGTTYDSVSSTTKYVGTATTGDYQVRNALRCKKPDGTLYSKFFTTSSSFGASESTMVMYCDKTEDAVQEAQYAANCGLTVSWATPCTAASTIWGPANVVTYRVNPGGSYDPKSKDTKYRTEAECIAPDGKKSFANAYSTGDMAGVVFPSCAAQGKGHGTGNIKVFVTPPGTTIENPTPIWTATPKAPDPSTPLCDSTRAGSGCKLAVQLDGQPCTMGVFACENWGDLSKTPDWSSRISCQWGPYAVPLSTCNPLERAYEPGGVPATEKNTDGDPTTKDDKQPDGSTAPKTGPITGTVPGGGGSPAPAPAPSGTPEASAQECWPNGWAVFNPLEWILKPLGCAFIPKTDVQAKARELSDKVSGKAPVSWIVSPPPLLGPSGGSCPTWVVKVGDSFSQNAVCDSSFTAAIRSIRAPLFGIVAAAMVWPLIRSIWYAAIPILRVTPSSGGK